MYICATKFIGTFTDVVFSLVLAGVVELVDTLDLGSSAARRGGSTPFTRTIKKN